jgi:HSP20 family protein
MKDLEILIQGNELTIKGRRQTIDGDDVQYHRRERGTGEFARFVTLPMEVNAEQVEATLKDGVLTIVMPKSAMARARKITVKTA